MSTYRIVRMFQNPSIRSKVIKRGLTLEEAQSHCRNPETSSRTATGTDAQCYTLAYGAWFDGYEEE
jgi:hypothetical protein